MSTESLIFTDTIKPKSDQLNADDLLVGPITVTVTGVKRGNAEQPISINISNGFQPFKPCKSMRRVLIAAWGDDGKHWIGKSLTLYADPSVKYGGVKVGGIRISHMSDLDKRNLSNGEMSFALTVTRGKREPFIVRPLAAAAVEQAAAVKPYPDDAFAQRLPHMRKAFHKDGWTIDKIAAQAEKTGRLTAVQRAAITEPEPAPEPVAEPPAATGNEF